MLSLFIAFFMMIVWMSAASSHFLGPIEEFFNHLTGFVKIIHDGKFVIFNTTVDFSYPIAAVGYIGFSYIFVLLSKVTKSADALILNLEQKSKIEEEKKINQELATSFRNKYLTQNRFIVVVTLKENETCKHISAEDANLSLNRLLSLLRKQRVDYDYIKKSKTVKMLFEDFRSIDTVIKCINYWSKNMIKADFIGIVLLNSDNVRSSFERILNIATPGKIMTDSRLKAKYDYLPGKAFRLSSEGTYLTKNSETEFFKFN